MSLEYVYETIFFFFSISKRYLKFKEREGTPGLADYILTTEGTPGQADLILRVRQVFGFLLLRLCQVSQAQKVAQKGVLRL